MPAHWDEVEWSRIDRGPLRGMRQGLGAAAGAARAGLSRYRMGPGERAMPVHVHADEEEIFYVLSGSGLSWQDGRTYALGAGDCVVHRAGAEAHTIVGGEDGLDVLAYSSGTNTGMTWLPRAKAWWMGPRWLPSDGPNPFRLEAAAGELGVAAGAQLSGLNHVEVAPGARNAAFHCHGAEEEIFVVLGGAGTLRLGEQSHPVLTGHVIARPPATGVAHQFIAGEEGLSLLAWGTREPNDITWYPDSRKVNLRGIGIKGRIDPLGYWDGED